MSGFVKQIPAKFILVSPSADLARERSDAPFDNHGSESHRAGGGFIRVSLVETSSVFLSAGTTRPFAVDVRCTGSHKCLADRPRAFESW